VRSRGPLRRLDRKTARKKTKPAATAARKPARSAPVRSQFFTAHGGPWGKCFRPRAEGERRYWLVKSEPDVFSWEDLMAAPRRTTHWNGVRNFAARNFMRDGMKKGDLVFFYHSNAEPPGIVGVCEVSRESYPDHTAFDRRHDGYDEGSSPDHPTWLMVDLRAVESLLRPVTLPMLKSSKPLARMALIRTGRLSVIPVSPLEWETIVAMGQN
jgi:predicted RNA-binding protein with PUA-like domain